MCVTLLGTGLNFLEFVLPCLSANNNALKCSWRQAVKLDINIERDLAYALKVRECPQILFLRGNRIVYREKGRLYGYTFKSYTKNRSFKLL